jgi:hypothetical protein
LKTHKYPGIRLLFLTLGACCVICTSPAADAQAVPYARTYAHSRDDVDKALKEFQAYAGQKLPIVDGFVAMGDQPLSRYERAFYQFSIDLLPGDSGGTIVRLTAKITAWYADPDPSKSGYQVLPSSGRLELDLLDRLSDEFAGKNVSLSHHSSLLAPRPKLDLGSSGNSTLNNKAVSSSTATSPSPDSPTEDAKAVAELRTKREAEEKRMLELKSELDSLKEIQHHQAHPRNLVIVKKSGTPVLARPEDAAKLLFTASENDEFEFIEVQGEWFHVHISGVSRGWIRRSRAEAMDVRWNAAPTSVTDGEKPTEVFHVAKEENGQFPGDWAVLQGKTVRIYWVQPTASPSAATSARDKREFAKNLFERAWNDPARSQNAFAGVVVLFDSSDGGQVSVPISVLEQWIERKGNDAAFWQKCSIDPMELFKN